MASATCPFPDCVQVLLVVASCLRFGKEMHSIRCLKALAMPVPFTAQASAIAAAGVRFSFAVLHCLCGMQAATAED